MFYYRSRYRLSVATAVTAVCLVVIAVTAPASAGVIASVFGEGTFPRVSDFQTFDPHDPATPTNGERTVKEDANLTDGTRHITQTFQLDSAITIDTIDIMFVRGNSGNSGILRIFDVANTRGDVFTDDFNDAVANEFLLDIQFTMPAGLDSASNVEQTLRLDLTGADEITLPATTAPAGYAFSLSSVVDGDTAVDNEVFTWRMGQGPDGANNTARLNNSWYVPGRLLYDDFNGANNTERRRDGLFALNGTLVPEPGSGLLLMLGITLGLVGVRRQQGDYSR